MLTKIYKKLKMINLLGIMLIISMILTLTTLPVTTVMAVYGPNFDCRDHNSSYTTDCNWDISWSKPESCVWNCNKHGNNYTHSHAGLSGACELCLYEPHTHTWAYSLDGANKIKATCSPNSGTCPDRKTLTLTISASATNYSGSAATITIGTNSEKTAWTGAGLTVPTTISYEKADETALNAAPITVGDYVAKVSPVGVDASTTNTAKVSYTIEQAHGADASKYVTDDTNHWNPCLRTDCTQQHKYNSAAHSYDGSTYKCVCEKVDPTYHQHNFATAWTVDATHHWHACIGSGATEACLNEKDAAKGEHGSWNNGRCGTCNYVCLHNGATTGTCSICKKSLGGGGYSGGSSGGSSSSGITVPVSGEGTTNVTANVSGNNATVSVNTNAINNAAGNNGQTGTDTITVNLSGLRQTVTSTTISKTDASNIAKTLNSSDNNKKFVEFKMSEYTVKIDSTAMNAVVNATTGNDLRLVVETTAPAAALNNNQQSELENKDVARTFEAYFVSNGNRIGNFNGGKVEIGVVEFKVPAGKNGSFYHVEYLPETGKAVRYQTRYVDGYLYFDTTHFSDYAIVYDEGVANGPETETTDDTEGTIDTGEVITTVKSPRTGDTIYFEVLTMTILACALIVLAMALKMRDAKVVAEDKSHKNFNSYKDAGEYLERFFRK